MKSYLTFADAHNKKNDNRNNNIINYNNKNNNYKINKPPWIPHCLV